MPKHDLPDGNETGGSLIDFMEHLRRRTVLGAPEDGRPEPESAPWDVYRLAENGDGRPPRLSWRDAMLAGLVLAMGLVLWVAIRR